MNDLLARANAVKTHVSLITFLREKIGYFGKTKAQQQICENLREHFTEAQKKLSLIVGDMPDLEKFRLALTQVDWDKFPDLLPKRMEALTQVVAPRCVVICMQLLRNVGIFTLYNEKKRYKEFQTDFACALAVSARNAGESR